MKPPTMRQLLEDPVYRAYVKTVPRLAPNLQWGNPWAVWARTTAGTWRGGQFPTYADAWALVVRGVRSSKYEDVAVVSRRQMFGPPGKWEDYKVKVKHTNGPDTIEVRQRWVQTFYWDEMYFQWCYRCRRPSSFRKRPGHHAMRSCPVEILDQTEDLNRCYFCGIRRCVMPGYHA